MMQPVFLGRDRLDANRFQNFLSLRAIEAELRSLDTHADSTESESDFIQYEVWVADEQAQTASDLITEFREQFDLTDAAHLGMDESLTPEPPADVPPLRARVPWLTAVFAAACVVVSIGFWRAGTLDSVEPFERWGWRDCYSVAEGSYWAIFTSQCIHFGVHHLAVNLLAIVPLGYVIERRFGHICWGGLLCLAALGASSAGLATTALMGIGASGIALACYGFVLVASLQRRILPLWLLILITLWLAPGIFFEFIFIADHHLGDSPLPSHSGYSHLAGLVLGGLYAAAFTMAWHPRIWRSALASLVVLALVPLHGSPWLASWNRGRADRAYEREGVGEAIEWYTRAIARSREPADIYVDRAFALIADGRLDEALADFDAALASNPTVRNARPGRATLMQMRSEYAAALAEVNLEIRDGTPTAYAFSVRGSIHFARLHLDDSIRDFAQAIELEPRTADYWTARGDARSEMSDIQGALADYEHALWLAPDDIAALAGRGSVLLHRNNLAAGSESLTRARELLLASLRLRPRLAWLHEMLAAVDLELFDVDEEKALLDEARRHCDDVLNLLPEYDYAWFLSGSIAYVERDFPRAEADLSRALELNPRSAWAACIRGETRHAAGRSNEALGDLDRALSLNPRFAYAYRCRGIVRHVLEDYSGAIEDYTRAVELSPRFAEAFTLRGQARQAIGDEAGARADFAEAAAIDPTRLTQPLN